MEYMLNCGMTPNILGNQAVRKRLVTFWKVVEARYTSERGFPNPLPAHLLMSAVELYARSDSAINLSDEADQEALVSELEGMEPSEFFLYVDAAFTQTKAWAMMRPDPGPEVVQQGRRMAPLERRLRLIDFVWERSFAFNDMHLVFRFFGGHDRIDWRSLYDEWIQTHDDPAKRSPEDMAKEFYRVVKDPETRRLFFERKDREIRALAEKDAAEGRTLGDSAAMIYSTMQYEGFPQEEPNE